MEKHLNLNNLKPNIKSMNVLKYPDLKIISQNDTEDIKFQLNQIKYLRSKIKYYVGIQNGTTIECANFKHYPKIFVSHKEYLINIIKCLKIIIDGIKNNNFIQHIIYNAKLQKKKLIFIITHMGKIGIFYSKN